MIEIRNLTKHYGTKTALDNVSLSIPDNSIVGLVGKNGAGKSTLLKILTGIMKADDGQCLFDGIEPGNASVADDIGYLPEQRGLYNTVSVQEQLEYFASLRGLNSIKRKDAISHWLNKFGIEDWKKKKISELSKGMQQKIQLITCLMHSPKYVFMDEPLSGIDPANFELFTDVIKEFQLEQHATIILSTHNMKSIEKMCDYVAFIDSAKLKLYDTIPNIKNKFAKRNKYIVTLEANDDTNAEETLNSIRCTLKDYKIVSSRMEMPTMDEIFIEMTK